MPEFIFSMIVVAATLIAACPQVVGL